MRHVRTSRQILIFPNINIPVVAVDWTYTGLNPEELEGRHTSVCERVLTANVGNIQYIESTTVDIQVIGASPDSGRTYGPRLIEIKGVTATQLHFRESPAVFLGEG